MESFFGLDLVTFLEAAGLVGFYLVIFAESGILLGIIFPGNSLLFTAGFLASQGIFNIFAVVIGGILAAVFGGYSGYAIGHRFGPRVFSRPNSRFFSPDYLERARAFYQNYGARSLILARFLPIFRTVVPLLAGVGAMGRAQFSLYNILGGIFWVVSITLCGYFLGRAVPNVDRYLLPIIVAIIVISFIPPAVSFVRARRRIAG